MVVEVYILGIACMFYLLVNPSETSNFADMRDCLAVIPLQLDCFWNQLEDRLHK